MSIIFYTDGYITKFNDETAFHAENKILTRTLASIRPIVHLLYYFFHLYKTFFFIKQVSIESDVFNYKIEQEAEQQLLLPPLLFCR